MKDQQIPKQKNGGLHDTESKKCLSSEMEAKDKFQVLKKRFFDVNQWRTFAGDLTAEFQLYNADGIQVERHPEIGDFVKIEIPGPGNIAGDGADWVKVVEINEESFEYDERCFMRFRPSENPTSQEKENEDVAHFFSDKASSNFLIYRQAHCIYAQIHGRNEVNNLETEKIPDKVRNAIVGFAGKMGVGKIQWKLLADGLLDLDKQ